LPASIGQVGAAAPVGGCNSWGLSHNRNKIAVVPIAILHQQLGFFTASVGADSDAGFDAKSEL